MSWHFSLALEEAFSEACSSDGAPSAPWRLTPTALDDSCSDKMKGACHRSPFGMMFVPSTDAHGGALLTWFREASPVRTSASPTPTATESTARKAASGESLLGSLARYDHDSCSWKTPQANNEGGIKIAFSGKSNARRIARAVRPRVSRLVGKYTVGSPEDRARNLVVEGDNLQAMATLYKERGQVDLIVTDPPYNTGKDFRYNDRWDEDPNDPGLGEFVSADDGARHTKWMRFMWPRLQMMKAMLKPAGVLAICIDHRELFRLGQMLDELFGQENRLAIINWQRSYSRTNDAEHVAITTEYVLVYARELDKVRTGLLPRDEVHDDGAPMPDGDPQPWTDAPATGSNAKAHKGMVYGIQSPFTGEIFYPPAGSAWRAGQDQNLAWLQGWGCKFVLRDIKDAKKRADHIGLGVDEVPNVSAIMVGESLDSASKKARTVQRTKPWPQFYFLKDGDGRPRLKKYLSQLKPGMTPTTYWANDPLDFPTELGSVSYPHQESGHSQQGVDELTNIVGNGHDFKTVKPLKLFQKLIDLWCPENGTVLDPFAGSGTCGHAILGSNAQSDASRRFILIEQGRPENGDSYARTLLADRLRRVITGDWANGKGKPLKGGFSFVALGKKVDATALLCMERDEMVDTVIASHFDATRRRGDQLVRIETSPPKGKAYRYLVAKNADNEGFFLVWDGANRNTDFTEPAYEICAEEAKRAGLRSAPYHVYARLYRYQTDGVRFYQIPDRILADFCPKCKPRRKPRRRSRTTVVLVNSERKTERG